MLGYMAENVRTGACDVVEYDEIDALTGAGWTLLDVRTERGARAGRDPRLDQPPARPSCAKTSTG